jgi:predicted MPP superfamily phosphohydrolase
MTEVDSEHDHNVRLLFNMSKYTWTTDCHLDHLRADGDLIDFAQKLIEQDPPGIFITGDISNAQHVVYHLSALEKIVQRPIFFVLGNHDYYNGDIETVRKSMVQVTKISQFLKYMPATPFIPLSPMTALVGHDGWYDGLNGDAKNSNFILNDWVMTKDFVPHSGGHAYVNSTGKIKNRDALLSHLQKLAHEGVQHVHDGIKTAARHHHKQIIVMTHVPPFPETHMFRGKQGDDNAQPWFTSKLMGDMLLAASAAYPDIKFTVLAGHTHGGYDGNIRPNLEVHVGHAEYGLPSIAGMIEVQ